MGRTNRDILGYVQRPGRRMLAVMNAKNKLQRKAAYTDLLSLRCFRSGIESGISWLKQCMGLTRCTWKGWEAFKS